MTPHKRLPLPPCPSLFRVDGFRLLTPCPPHRRRSFGRWPPSITTPSTTTLRTHGCCGSSSPTPRWAPGHASRGGSRRVRWTAACRRRLPVGLSLRAGRGGCSGRRRRGESSRLINRRSWEWLSFVRVCVWGWVVEQLEIYWWHDMVTQWGLYLQFKRVGVHPGRNTLCKFF